ERHVAVLEIAGERAAAAAVHVMGLRFGRFGGVAADEPVRFMDIETADALRVGVFDNGHGVIADHLLGVTVPSGIYGHPAALLAHRGERLHHIGGAFG